MPKGSHWKNQNTNQAERQDGNGAISRRGEGVGYWFSTNFPHFDAWEMTARAAHLSCDEAEWA